MSRLSAGTGLQTVIPAPEGSGTFGSSVTVLPNGNFVVTDPEYGTFREGAVYLYDGITLEIISVFIGGSHWHIFDSLSIQVLNNGNFLILSPFWRDGDGNQGAITWGSAVSGVSGGISSSNSLLNTGSDIAGGITLLSNGNYVVSIPDWNQNRGAVVWGDGAKGSSGMVSPSMALTGDVAGDMIGSGGITELANGHYVISSAGWNEGRGAVTWASGASGVSGGISAGNSLVGAMPGDYAGDITPLSNGNYVVTSPAWNAERGAVTWCDGALGGKGVISPDNSLVGTRSRDTVGGSFSGVLSIIALPNGHYVVGSPLWNERRGAVTWGDGSLGVKGEVSAHNSLIGDSPGDEVGAYGEASQILVLPNGNYVVSSYNWNRYRGAVTWGDGTTGVTGGITSANSLVGTTLYPNVGAAVMLSNGNYVARGVKSATWGSGTAGVTGEVSSANSLVSGEGVDSIFPLRNGHYVVCSRNWSDRRGAVTWGNGLTGIRGAVSSVNSLVGGAALSEVGAGGIVPLTNGNFVVCSPYWGGARVGALTLGNGASGSVGVVSELNSLVGEREWDMTMTYWSITPLPNGNFVASFPSWNEGRGAVIWGSGERGGTGRISAANALIGSLPFEPVGAMPDNSNAVVVLADGHYCVQSPYWNGGRGAVTWGDGNAGVSGEISAANSLLGDQAKGSHEVYAAPQTVTPLGNGGYLVHTPDWDGWKGAITWAGGVGGITGEITEGNSLVGTSQKDPLGNYPAHIVVPDRDYYAVISSWRRHGAVTAGDSTNGTRGWINAWNSFLAPMEHGWSFETIYDPARQRLLASQSTSNTVALIRFAPDIRVEGQPGAAVLDTSLTEEARNLNFGGVTIGGGDRTGTFRLFDAGTMRLRLTGDPKVAVTGANAADFMVTKQPEAFSADESLAFFDIRFAPMHAGPRTAVISIATNAGGGGPFQFTVRGTGLSPNAFADWQRSFFGETVMNTAAQEDFDADGVSNLLEFAFGTVPHDAGSGPSPVKYTGPASGGGSITTLGGPVILSGNGSFLGRFVRRSDYSSAGLTYTPQFSSDLVNWRSSPAQPVVMAEDDGKQIVQVPSPSLDPGAPTGFFRLLVDLAP